MRIRNTARRGNFWVLLVERFYSNLAILVTDREEADRLRLHIWAMALLRNSWDNINTDEPVDSLRDTLFFRLVEFALMQVCILILFLVTGIPSTDDNFFQSCYE
jgi:hypothetical protein